MDIPDDAFETILEQMKQVQFAIRDIRAELGKWRRAPVETASPIQAEVIEPPTEKQIIFLRGLGVEDIPETKEAARQLLLELNAKRQAGEYSVPPTAKQLRYLRDLKYAGPMPESKDEAWKLLRELNQASE